MTPAKPSRLFLLRHARAGWAEPGGSDHDRALDARGIAEASHLGDLLRTCGERFDAVISSTALRCRQTIEHLGIGLFEAEPKLAPELYGGGIEAYRAAGRVLAENSTLLVVGHNPTIEAFALELTGDQPDVLAAGFPTCGLAIFEVPDVSEKLRIGSARFVEAIWP